MYLSNNATIDLSGDQITLLGKKIWQSECNGSYDGLLTWNKGELFPSLGIGHFIWYPEDCKNHLFDQTFPNLVRYLVKHNVLVPAWLVKQISRGCPWKDKETFMAAKGSVEMQDMKKLLSETIELQTHFIIARFEQEIKKIIQTTPKVHKAKVKKNFKQLSAQHQGIFALIDYTHFKGSGTKSNESYNGHKWGLADVLISMQEAKTHEQALNHFVHTAKQLLTDRVEHAPDKQKEQAWLKGWHARVDRYLQT